jgi:hypothetical protein
LIAATAPFAIARNLSKDLILPVRLRINSAMGRDRHE